MLSETSSGVSTEVAEEFCDAQDPLRCELWSRAWRSHADDGVSSDDLSDEELLASAWAELQGQRPRRTKPLVGSLKYVELYLSGLTLPQVGKACGTAAGVALRRLAKCGVKRRPRGRPECVIDDPQLVSLYDAGWSTHRLAAKYGVSPRTIRKLLSERGRKCRSKSEAVRLAVLKRHG